MHISITTSCYQLFPMFASIGFVVFFVEGAFLIARFWFGGEVWAHDSLVSLLSTFGTDSDGGMWNVGAIVN